MNRLWQCNGRIREVSEFALPALYQESLETIFSIVAEIPRDSLLLFLVTGSCSRNQVQVGWSDLDVEIGLRTHRYDVASALVEATKQCPIKVGITLYSERELEEGLVLARTVYTHYLLQSNIIYPSYATKDLRICKVTKNDVIRSGMAILPERLHELRRWLASPDIESDSRTIIKVTTQVMKVLLLSDGIQTDSYSQVFLAFAEKYGVSSQSALDLIQGRKFQGSLRNYVRQILDVFNSR